MKALIDTSYLIESLHGEDLDLPDDSAISVMTAAELRIGVLVAEDEALKAERLRTLEKVTQAFEPLPVSDSVSDHFAGLVSRMRSLGKKPQIIDTLIAATAAANDLPIYTRDSDFKNFEGYENLKITIV